MLFNILFLFFLLFRRIAALESLCSDGKSEIKCLCKKFTNPDTGFPNLLADCTGLEIKKFPSITQFPRDVSILDFSLNNIDTLDPSIVNVSSYTLKKLVLSHNRINYVDARFFGGLPELRMLDLSYNKISSLEDESIFSKQKSLVYIDLSFNNLKELPIGVFKSLPLRYLDLSYNPLIYSLMESKDVLSNSLGISTNISHLKLNNIGFHTLHPIFFNSYTSLKHLELADNNFELIPSMPYSVEYLDFSGNNLSFVSAKYLNYHSLKVLKLSRMPSLISIHHYAFYNLQSLEQLIIADCPNVKEFTELAFGLASKTTDIHPKTLVLARNGLKSLNSTYKHMFRRMEHIDLRHNPWKCDCDILWLQEFSNELFKSKEIRCATPINLKNKNVLDLNVLDLQHCYPEVYGKSSHRIIIIFLMALIMCLIGFIFYLIRYPIPMANMRRIGISPHSPYNPAPQDDRY